MEELKELEEISRMIIGLQNSLRSSIRLRRIKLVTRHSLLFFSYLLLCLSVQIRVQQKLKSNPFRFTRHSFLDTFHSTNKPINLIYPVKYRQISIAHLTGINQSTISVVTGHYSLATICQTCNFSP